MPLYWGYHFPYIRENLRSDGTVKTEEYPWKGIYERTLDGDNNDLGIGKLGQGNLTPQILNKKDLGKAACSA